MNIAPILTLLAFGQYPDALDHLRAGEVAPQVGLLLDRSCSMGGGYQNTNCTWYAANYRGGNQNFNKKDQMKSVLVGCKSPTDGILDRWADRINFSIYEFGSGAWLKVPFDSSLSALEAGVLQIPSSGSTYMTKGLRDHGRYISQYFTGANTLDCRPNFLVMLSDGNPNGGASTFDFECSVPPESRYVKSNQPWFGSDYLYNKPDLLCGLPGDQNIRTYTIGFGSPGSFSPSNLQNIADYGGGEYFYASDAAQLSVAFENIATEIVSKSALFFAPIAIQTESLFSGNYAYSASFKPQAGGPWRGTVKKHCVVPQVDINGAYDTSSDACLFTSSDGENLDTNPDVVDLWTGQRSIAADVGGAGEVLFQRIGAAGGGEPKAPYWSHRKILSWRAGDTGYVDVAPSTWKDEDSWTNGCEHHRLMNFIHGYTYDADCNNGKPVAINNWPLGDPVGASPVLLQYGPCHDPSDQPIAGNCYLASAMNDGMLHIFDAATGDERSALIPSELWQPSDVVNSTLREIMDQPNIHYTHRYYLDGNARLFHHDSNSDGYIQDAEHAVLIFGLGRGGRAMYRLDVSELNGGILDGSRNPVAPLLPTEGSAMEELQDTWAAPWMGLARSAGQLYDAAAFGSGHIAFLDLVEELQAPVNTPPTPPTINTDDAQQINCEGSGHFADFNGLDKAKWCNSMWFSKCKGKGSKPCYDGAHVPLDVSTQPLSYNDGLHQTAALRLYFSDFDLEDGDVLRIEDGDGSLVGAYTRRMLRKAWSPWIFHSQVVLRLITNGNDSKNRGYKLKKVKWVPGLPIVGGGAPVGVPPVRPAGFELGVDHHPTIYLTDLARWNGSSVQNFSDSASGDGLLLRVTNDCGTNTTNCMDAGDQPDLAHMVCPISAEVSAFQRAGVLEALYWGDECGQIFKLWTEDKGATYLARRLINLNNGKKEVSKNARKIFRKLDLVSSLCSGKLVTGVYFGTGDIQRPTSKDELQDPSMTNGRDIIGVLWDDGALPADLTQSDLKELTNTTGLTAQQIVASGKQGWFISLGTNERMLRDPLIFDRVAFYKTYEPTQGAVECGGGSGVDRIYAINSCDGSSVNDANSDGSRTISEREVWNGETEVGGGLFFFTPKDSPVLVSHADITKRQNAVLNPRRRTRPGLFLWREK